MADRMFSARLQRHFRQFLRPGTTCSLALMLTLLLGISASIAQTRTEAQMSLRIGALEDQIRGMTGQMERLNHEIRQLNEKLRRFSEDTEYRFRELSPGGSNGRRSEHRPPAGSSPAPQQRYSGATDNQVPNRSSAQVGTRPAPLGTLSLDANPSGPININPGSGFRQQTQNFADPNAPVTTGFGNPLIGNGGVVQNPGQVAIGVPMDSRSEYDVAYSYILQRDFDSAEAAFSAFLISYPGDNLTGNAQYWLGESYYARGMFRPAADAFLKGYSDNRRSQKAPDSLLKLGMSLVQLGQKDAACATFSELAKKFPSASPSVLQRASREAERARC